MGGKFSRLTLLLVPRRSSGLLGRNRSCGLTMPATTPLLPAASSLTLPTGAKGGSSCPGHTSPGELHIWLPTSLSRLPASLGCAATAFLESGRAGVTLRGAGAPFLPPDVPSGAGRHTGGRTDHPAHALARSRAHSSAHSLTCLVRLGVLLGVKTRSAAGVRSLRASSRASYARWSPPSPWAEASRARPARLLEAPSGRSCLQLCPQPFLQAAADPAAAT